MLIKINPYAVASAQLCPLFLLILTTMFAALTFLQYSSYV
jgi:hypothetical protein